MENESISDLNRHLEWKDVESSDFKKEIHFNGMFFDKKCFSCGVLGKIKQLHQIEHEFLRTSGNFVFVKSGFICDDCKWRIVV